LEPLVLPPRPWLPDLEIKINWLIPLLSLLACTQCKFQL
jgi:hypothetical protein